MKYATARPFADPETAARKLVEIASGIEPVQDGRIYIELVKRAIPVPAQRQRRGVSYRPQSRRRARLAGAARERDFRPADQSGRGPVRLDPCRNRNSATRANALNHDSSI